MPKIYLSSIKKNNKRYDVIINDNDDKYEFKISEDLLIEMMFFNPKELSLAQYQEFLNKLPLDSLVYEGMKYIDKRPRSKKEIINHLYDYTNSRDLIDEAIRMLEVKGLIDDESYKDAVLNNEIYFKRSGVNIINQKLNEFGLSLVFDYPIETLKDNILFLEKKYLQKAKKEPYPKLVGKLKVHLLSKGYTEGQIERFIDYSLIPRYKEDELDKKDTTYNRFNKKINNMSRGENDE